MRQMIVAVFDKTAEVFGRPLFVRTEAEAVRSFETQCRDRGPADGANPLFTHPGEFALYDLGWFDDVSGKFDTHEVPRRVLEGSAAALHVKAHFGVMNHPGGVNESVA